MLWLGCGLFLERNWVGVGVVVSFCEKIVLMLLLGCVIKSNCGCGCGWGHSSGLIVLWLWLWLSRIQDTGYKRCLDSRPVCLPVE